jgi:thiol-disulfide isomerase/thioredoxin
MKSLLLLSLLTISISCFTQSNDGQLTFIIKNQAPNLHLSITDASLRPQQMNFEEGYNDTITLRLKFPVMIGGFTSFAKSEYQIGFNVMENDTIELLINKNGTIAKRLLNKDKLSEQRNKDISALDIIDNPYLNEIIKASKKHDIEKFKLNCKLGFEDRKRKLLAIYKGMEAHPFVVERINSLALNQQFMLFRFFLRENFLNEETAFTYFKDSIFNKTVEMKMIAHTYNASAIGTLAIFLTKHFPKIYTAEKMFDFFLGAPASTLRKERLLYYLKSSKRIGTYDSLSQIVLANYNDTATKRIVEKYRNLRFLNQSSLQQSKFINIKNEILNLDTILNSHKGKYIYLDFWASWCAPCIAEMPKSKLLAQKFADKLALIYISVDNEIDAWLNRAESLHIMDAEHYLLSDGIFVFAGKKYPITSIPRYMLIDKEGNLLDDNAPKPSDKASVGLLKKLQ